MTERLPVLALTMGDVAGIGPELIAEVLSDPVLFTTCQPVVIGHPKILERAMNLRGLVQSIHAVSSAEEVHSTESQILCLDCGPEETSEVPPGQVDRRAGQAAHDYLLGAIEGCLAGHFDGIVTAPLNKAALRAAGISHPGHTEILAERCGVSEYAMMLYLPPGQIIPGEFGLGVAHVTLHTSIKSVPDLITREAVGDKIRLMDGFLKQLGHPQPHIGVAALNPHAGEEGLFGDEESTIIAPAVTEERANSIFVDGPIPADALMRLAAAGEYDGVIAMYHDQGHIALKLLGYDRAVNVTLGLPIVRTSPSHGTAYDIAWQGKADATGLRSAIAMACQMTSHSSL